MLVVKSNYKRKYRKTTSSMSLLASRKMERICRKGYVMNENVVSQLFNTIPAHTAFEQCSHRTKLAS